MRSHATEAEPSACSGARHSAGWDENQETAIQSPHGGTKIAWGGPPVAPLTVPARQWFELVPDTDPDSEIERLVSLGASRASRSEPGAVVLADPDGNEFRLRTD